MRDPQVGDIYHSRYNDAHFLITKIVRRKGHPSRFFILWLDKFLVAEDETDINPFRWYHYRWVA